jgi:hypothetical protein
MDRPLPRERERPEKGKLMHNLNGRNRGAPQATAHVVNGEHVPAKGTALTKAPASTAISVVTAKAPPATVKRGVLELMVAFPLVGAAEDEAQVLMGIYFEAVEGFELPVVEYALKWLLFHNPRNTPTFTQPPTPQDVFEMCECVRATWRRRTLAYFMACDIVGRERQFEWGTEPYSGLLSWPKFPWGPEPLQPGCHIPEAMVLGWVRDWTNDPDNQDIIIGLAQEKFDAIPDEAFAEGEREKVIARREEYAKAEAAKAEAEPEAAAADFSSKLVETGLSSTALPISRDRSCAVATTLGMP